MRTLALALLLGVAVSGCRIKKDPTYDAAAATCAPVARACLNHSQCCSYACVEGVCIANSTAGGLCKTSDDCNYTLTCVSGRCVPGYTCQPTAGDTCTSNNECCSGNCVGENTSAYPMVAGQCGTETAPTVELGGPFTVPYYATTTLHATVTDPDAEDVVYYAWDVQSAPSGGATGWTGTGASPSIFLSAKGTYVLRVRVVDGLASQRNRNASGTGAVVPVQDTVTIVAVNYAPVVDAEPTHVATTTALRNTPITLAGAVSDPNGTAVSCAWYAKPHGQPEISTPIVSYANCPASPTVSYTTSVDGPEGDWDFRLEAFDGEYTTSAVRRVNVINAAPVAIACAYECATPPASGVPGLRVGNLGPAPGTAPSIPLHGSATDANTSAGIGDVGQTRFTWEWVLDEKPATSTRTVGAILGSSALSGAHAPPFDSALDPDVAGTYVVRLHVDDGWPGGSDDATVQVYVEPYLRPLHPLDGNGLPSGSVADAAYLHAATAASDRIVFVGRNSVIGDGLWILDPETTWSGATMVNESPRCVGFTRDGATAIIGGTDGFGTSKWERVTLSGPTANGTNAFGTGWTGLPNDVVSTGGKEFVVSSSGLVHTFANSGVGSTTTTEVPQCDNCTPSLAVVGSHGAAATDVLYLLTASGDLRRFDVTNPGRLVFSPTSPVATGSSDLWVSALHNTSKQEVAVSSGMLLDATGLGSTTVAATLPSSARFVDTATPSGASGALVGIMIGGDGSLVKLDGSYAGAGALRVPRVGWLGTGYPLTARWAFVRSDGTVRYVILSATVGPEVRWYLARY